jgi:hypothetical protein
MLKPLGPRAVDFRGGLWREYQNLNSRVIIDHCVEWMERIGWLGNFDRAAAGTVANDHAGIEFVDSEVYKILEAMAWELGQREDPELSEKFDLIVARVAAAQDDDGYLNTSFGRSGQRSRFSDLEWGHELYCFGHLIQAGVARIRTGRDDLLPAVARRAADFLYAEFGPDGRATVEGHPEIEVALVELARATGEQRYLELAKLLVDRRGYGTLGDIEYGAEYFQDDMPVRDADVLRGHAVRALYLSAGALDVAVETGDDALASAIARQWDATVSRRTYITGGMGSHHRDEAFGADFELPPDRAYAETCAGIASVMLSWRLLLATGEAKYADLIERTLLNAVLVSPQEDGRAFFYANTLHQRVAGHPSNPHEASKRAESSLRAPWFEVSCCPTNVSRTLASASMYFATSSGEGLQIHQYGSYQVDTTVAGDRLALRVESDYPFDGRISIDIDDAPSRAWTLRLRIPAWAHQDATWQCNAQGAACTFTDGYLDISGTMKSGDRVELVLPMNPRFTYPHPDIDAVRGQVAVERGPLVLALESPDLPHGVDLADVAIDTASAIVATDDGASVSISASRSHVDAQWPYVSAPTSMASSRSTAHLRPYFRWGNKGPSTMRVFIPVAQ